MLNRRKREEGFSLLEFLIAATILTQLLAAIFSLETKVFQRLNQTKQKHQNTQLAREWNPENLAAHCSLSTAPGKEVVSCHRSDPQTSRTFYFSALGG